MCSVTYKIWDFKYDYLKVEIELLYKVKFKKSFMLNFVYTAVFKVSFFVGKEFVSQLLHFKSIFYFILFYIYLPII